MRSAQDTPGITLVRPMETFGDDDCPKGHMEILFEARTELHGALTNVTEVQELHN